MRAGWKTNPLKRFCTILVLACVGVPGVAAAKDYLVTAVRPNILAVVDAKARKIEKMYPIPDTWKGNGPATVTVSKDGKTAYVIHNRWESVSGIDLDTGREVFRADFSTPDMRVKATFAMDISPDGKELAVFLMPTKLLPGEYSVQDTYIAVYDTSSGVAAKPVRTFPAPRRTTILGYSPDSSKLFAFSWDIYTFDAKDGKLLGTHKVRNWGRPNFGEPDALAVWPQWDASNVFAAPYVVARTDKKPGRPDALRAGILTFDLTTEKLAWKEFENASVVLFSAVVNPVRRNEAYTVYSTLTKTDVNKGRLVKRIDLDHTYYNINISSDGKELYTAGAQHDIAVYDTGTLKRIGTIRFPSGNDQGLSSLRLVRR